MRRVVSTRSAIGYNQTTLNEAFSGQRGYDDDVFDDFEDPFAPPIEKLELAAPPRPAATKKRGPAYSDQEVRALAAFGEGGDVVKNVSYAVRTWQRLEILRSDLGRHRERLGAALKVRDEELLLLASKLPVLDPAELTQDDSAAHAVGSQRALDALHAGEAGAILAAPSLGAFADARAASRDAALHAAAINGVDDSAYRRGAEIIAFLVSLVVVILALLVLL